MSLVMNNHHQETTDTDWTMKKYPT